MQRAAACKQQILTCRLHGGKQSSLWLRLVSVSSLPASEGECQRSSEPVILCKGQRGFISEALCGQGPWHMKISTFLVMTLQILCVCILTMHPGLIWRHL